MDQFTSSNSRHALVIRHGYVHYAGRVKAVRFDQPVVVDCLSIVYMQNNNGSDHIPVQALQIYMVLIAVLVWARRSWKMGRYFCVNILHTGSPL